MTGSVKIGDKVRFINAKGGGIVRRFQSKNVVLVEEDDGFETPILISEVVVVQETDKYNFPIEDKKATKEEETKVLESCKTGYDNIENDACIEPETSIETQTSKISINNASLEELMTLSGIGEAKAKSIIEYREQNGGFNSIEDIKNVTGIGDALFDQIKENITL